MSNNRIDLESIFQKEKVHHERVILCYQKVLSRINSRITVTAKNPLRPKYITYEIPFFMFECISYNVGDCLLFLRQELEGDKFRVTVFPPYTLHISWEHYVPEYVREAFFERTGQHINSSGELESNSSVSRSNSNLQHSETKQQKQHIQEEGGKISEIYDESHYRLLAKAMGEKTQRG